MAIGSLLAQAAASGDGAKLEQVVRSLEQLVETTPEILGVDVIPGQMVMVRAALAADGCRMPRLNVKRTYGDEMEETHRITLWCGTYPHEDGYSGDIPSHPDDGSLRGRAAQAIQALCRAAIEEGFHRVQLMAPAP